jgi:hypothetical protein
VGAALGTVETFLGHMAAEIRTKSTTTAADGGAGREASRTRAAGATLAQLMCLTCQKGGATFLGPMNTGMTTPSTSGVGAGGEDRAANGTKGVGAGARRARRRGLTCQTRPVCLRRGKRQTATRRSSRHHLQRPLQKATTAPQSNSAAFCRCFSLSLSLSLSLSPSSPFTTLGPRLRALNPEIS